MVLIGENKGFKIYFDCNNQIYNVFKDDKFLIGGKYKYSQVKTYID